jgi:phosphosulfolactate synthase
VTVGSRPTPTSEPEPFLSLPERAPKPRRRGLTHVLDKGLSSAALESLVETAGPSIDFVKLGWGTGYISGGLAAKVALCRRAGIRLTAGGTLFEAAYRQGLVPAYARWLERWGITDIEVSNGAVAIPPTEKQALIRSLSADFTVVSEVGSKRPHDEVVISRWVAEFMGDLEAGASLVIAEGRESGTVGLYGPGGQVRHRLVEAIVAEVPADLVIFEAPQRQQQVWFIRRLGSDVNLGNIAPDEVVALETLRLGLRADTIDLLPEGPPIAGRPTAYDVDAAGSAVRRNPAFDELEPPVLVTVACPGCGWERMTMAHDDAGVERASRCPHCGTGTRLVRAADVRRSMCACCY